MASSKPTSPLVEFSYASKAVRDLPAAALLRMAQDAWSRNMRLGVTGSLEFEDGEFRQVIEGPSVVLLPIISRILTDPRHEAISIGGFRPIMSRGFKTWTATGFDFCGDIPIGEDTPEADLTTAIDRGFPAKIASIRG